MDGSRTVSLRNLECRMSIPLLETARLQIRRLTLADLEAVHRPLAAGILEHRP